MLKTEQRIESDFYAIVKGSVLGKALRGGVYRPDMRPKGATTEDAVVKYLAGNCNKVTQDGVVVVNIYVPDITTADGSRVCDMARIEELEELVLQMVAEDESEYWVETDGDPSTTKHEEIDQHCICVRLAYSRVAG